MSWQRACSKERYDMKLSIIALDYDGTIARDGVLDPQVRDAVARIRTRGITVLLVTGRILSELARVAGDLHFVDGVVAENGAVLHVPATGHTTTLAPPVHAAFVEELRRRGRPFSHGECLVDADASEAPHLLDVIRTMQLPLVLAFNGGRVMVLTQGVSKATGLQAMLARLRVSARNALAIGDAENDHELLRLAEVGVAVEWGSQALRSVADVVLPGSGPADVARYLNSLDPRAPLPIPARARRRLRLGHTEDGREFSLGVKGRNVLVAGDAKSGKSWVAGLLCEQLILQGYCVCVIDPEGDYRTLEGLPGVSVLGGEEPAPTPRELLRALRYPDRSVVVDLSRMSYEEKIPYMRTLLPTLNTLRRRTGLPHRIVIDEAHYFLHGDEMAGLMDLERNGYTIVTYRASQLPAAVLAAAEVIVVTCESNPCEIEALKRCCSRCQDVEPANWAVLSHLQTGQAVALPVTEETGGELRLFNLGVRLTPHVRHREKYVDVPVLNDRAFVFRANGVPTPSQARTLRAFVETLEQAAPRAIEGYLQRSDFSRWIKEVFGDHALASEIATIERERRGGTLGEIVAEIAGAIRARYDLVEDEADAPAA
jgi:hydroxymethylpyrimidine pyrophosphatase-like HAD family hydrolase